MNIKKGLFAYITILSLVTVLVGNMAFATTIEAERFQTEFTFVSCGELNSSQLERGCEEELTAIKSSHTEEADKNKSFDNEKSNAKKEAKINLDIRSEDKDKAGLGEKNTKRKEARDNTVGNDKKYAIDTNVKHCKIQVEDKEGGYASGDKVRFKLNIEDKHELIEESLYVIKKADKEQVIYCDDEGGGHYNFSMPSYDVVIFAECKLKKDAKFNVKANIKQAITEFENNKSEYERGENVRFRIFTEQDKTIDEESIEVRGRASGRQLDYRYIEKGRYSFTMPAEDVLIKANIEEMQKPLLESIDISSFRKKKKIKIGRESRTVRSDLRKGVTDFDLKINPIGKNKVIDVRYTSLQGDEVKLFVDENYSIKSVGVGSKNQAELGGDVVLKISVMDDDENIGKYRFILRTQADDSIKKGCDIFAIKQNGVELDKKEGEDGNIKLYNSLFPTEVKDAKAQPAEVTLEVYPFYEAFAEPVQVVSLGRSFIKTKGKYGTCYKSSKVILKPGKRTLLPVSVKFADGHIEKFKYKISNTSYRVEKMRILSKEGEVIATFGAKLNGESLPDSVLRHDDEGYIRLELKKGDYKLRVKGYEHRFSVGENNTEGIPTRKSDINTDISVHKVRFSGMNPEGFISVKQVDTREYFLKNSDENSVFLPKGRYEYKYTRNGIYCRKGFFVGKDDIDIVLGKPELRDPEIIAENLSKLEEIKSVIDDDTVKINMPGYADDGIEAEIEVADYGAQVVIEYAEVPRIKFGREEQTAYLRYRIRNKKDLKGGTYYTDYMPLFIPSNGYYDLPDVKTLKLIFMQKPGSHIRSSIKVKEEKDRIKYGQYRVFYKFSYGGKNAVISSETKDPDSPFQQQGVNLSSSEATTFMWKYSGEGIPIYTTKKEQGEVEIEAWFEDEAGNKSKSGRIKVIKDSFPPVVKARIDDKTGVYEARGIDSNGNVSLLPKPVKPIYSNKPVKIEIEATDVNDGYYSNLAEKPYSFDGGKTWTAKNVHEISENGRFVFMDIRVKDRAGNQTFNTIDKEIIEDYPFNVIYVFVDMEPPVIEQVSSSTEGKKLYLDVMASDEKAGLHEKAYSFDGGKRWQKSNKHVRDLTDNSYKASDIRVRDAAGNISEYNSNFIWDADNLDVKPPVIENVKIVYEDKGVIGQDGRIWHRKAEVQIEASDEGSGIAGYSFDGVKFSKKNSRTYDEPVVLGNIKVIDRAGNVARHTVVRLERLDSRPPYFELKTGISQYGRAVQDFPLNISGDDREGVGRIRWTAILEPGEEKGERFSNEDVISAKRDLLFKYGDIEKWKEFFDANRDKKNISKTGVMIVASDALGNQDVKYREIPLALIDIYPPVIRGVTVEYKYFNPKTKKVRVYVSARDPVQGSGLQAKPYSFDGGRTWQKNPYVTLPVGRLLAHGNIKVRDRFNNVAGYRKDVRTNLQNVISGIHNLEKKPPKEELDRIKKAYEELTQEEKEKVYNWEDFLSALNNYHESEFDKGKYDEKDKPDVPDDPADKNGKEEDTESRGGESNSGDSNTPPEGEKNTGDENSRESNGRTTGKVRNTAAGKENSGRQKNVFNLTAKAVTNTVKIPDSEGSGSSRILKEVNIDKKRGLENIAAKLIDPETITMMLIVVFITLLYGGFRKNWQYRKER